MLSYTTLQNIISIARMVIDITIIALLVYYGLKLVRNNSRAIQIFKGVILIIIVRAVVTFFGLKAASAILDTWYSGDSSRSSSSSSRRSGLYWKNWGNPASSAAFLPWTATKGRNWWTNWWMPA